MRSPSEERARCTRVAIRVEVLQDIYAKYWTPAGSCADQVEEEEDDAQLTVEHMSGFPRVQDPEHSWRAKDRRMHGIWIVVRSIGRECPSKSEKA